VHADGELHNRVVRRVGRAIQLNYPLSRRKLQEFGFVRARGRAKISSRMWSISYAAS
jgi:hypothetical protein